MVVKYLYSNRNPAEDHVDARGLDARRSDLFNLMDIDKYKMSGSVMIESTALKELSFSTVLMLFSSRQILTDDEIPIEQLLEGIKSALTEHKILLELIDTEILDQKSEVMPLINVISKADFDKLQSASSRMNYTAPPKDFSSDAISTVMSTLVRRIKLTRVESKKLQIEKEFAKKLINLDLSEQKSEQELLQILIDAEDEFSGMDDDVTKIIEDYKNGVEFQAPPTQRDVEKTKKTLASGIGAFFKAKQAAATVPNFVEMFTE